MDEEFLEEETQLFAKSMKVFNEESSDRLCFDEKGEPFTGVLNGFDEKLQGEKKEYKDGYLVHYEVRKNGDDFYCSFDCIGDEIHVIEEIMKRREQDKCLCKFHRNGYYDAESKYTGTIESFREYDKGLVVGRFTEFEQDVISYMRDTDKDRTYMHNSVVFYEAGKPVRTSEGMIRNNGECYELTDNVMTHKWMQADGKKHGVEQFFDTAGLVREKLWKNGISGEKNEVGKDTAEKMLRLKNSGGNNHKIIHNVIKKVWKRAAAKRIEKEKNIEARTGGKSILPVMTKNEKIKEMLKEFFGLSK